MRRTLLVLVVCWLGLAQPGSAKPDGSEHDFTQREGAATLEMMWSSKPGAEHIELSDSIWVRLTIEGSEALRVHAPLDLPLNAKWVLVERHKPDRAAIGPTRIRWRLLYRFAPREPGSLIFQFPDVTFRDEDGKDQVVAWREKSFTVTTQITKLDRSQIRGSADIEALPAPIEPEPTWRKEILLGGAGLVLVAIMIGLRRFFRRREPKSAEHWAQYEWQRLVALKLPEQGRSERFITLLTLILRRYLERRFNLPARRQTTPEFLQGLSQQQALSAKEKEFLAAFLVLGDTVKFADTPMTADDCTQWADRARQFFDKS